MSNLNGRATVGAARIENSMAAARLAAHDAGTVGTVCYSETVKHAASASVRIVTVCSRCDDRRLARRSWHRRFEIVRGRKLVDQNPVAVWAIADRLPQAEADGRRSRHRALRQLDRPAASLVR